MHKFLQRQWESVKLFFIQIRSYFIIRKNFNREIVRLQNLYRVERDDNEQAIVDLKMEHLHELHKLKQELIYKVSQERVAEILAIAPASKSPESLRPDAYRLYLEEAEQLYKLRPWKDIVRKFQKEQADFIICKSDGGNIGQLQILISRGGILFANYAEEALNKLHVEWMSIRTGNKELSDEERYSIFL